MLKNNQTVDPLNPYAKAVKRISTKRGKTDDDYAQMGRIEWEGSLYFDTDETNPPKLEAIPCKCRGKLIIPKRMFVAMIANAASKTKGIVSKKECPSVAWVEQDAILETKADPSDLNAMYDSGKFCSREAVVVNNKRVMRVRPIFFKWALEFTVTFCPDLLNRSDLDRLMEVASQRCGLGERRPMLGRFDIL
jgi:hypothetical protein